jgi:(R,R)-butanediol dehydrogenase / meso-butanediol dehydrogenase / diacetyl reductase
MLGAVWYGPRDLRIEEVPEPEPGPDQVLIEVSRNGICGSDLHTYVGSNTGGASMHVPGVVLGHEFAGQVVGLGEGVDDLLIGAVVAVAPIEYCGTCWSCRHGHPNTCRSVALYGGYRQPLHGGLARRVAVSRRSAFVVPEALDSVAAALTEPVAVAVHAVRLAPRTLGSSVLILGAGPVGLAILASVRAAGASVIVVSEPSTRRRAAAEAFGATAVIDPTETNLGQATREVIGDDGVDLVFDTTAVHHAFNAGLRALRPQGTMISVAGWQEQARVDMGIAMGKEANIRFTMTYEPEVDFPAAMALLAERTLDPHLLISDQIPLEEVIEGGLEELLHHNDGHIKILVDPSTA